MLDQVLDIIQKYNERLAGIAVVILILLMSWSLASSVLLFLQYNPQSGSQAINSPYPISQSQNTGRPSHTELSLLNLFGSVSDNASTEKQIIDAPATRLNLELLGIFQSDIASESAAIIGEKGRDGELYHLGEILPGNAELHEVYDQYVLIKRGGNIEKLMFAEGTYSRPVYARTRGESDSDLEEESGMADDPNADMNTLYPDGGIPSPANSEQALEVLKNRIESDPSGLLAEYGVEPVEEGAANGYEIKSDAAGALLRRSGLKEGDIILSVNGQPVGNIGNDTAFLEQFRNVKRVRIEVQRGDRKFFVTVPLDL